MNDEVKITIKGHEFPVKFPNVGQFYQIEATKQSLARGFYNTMVVSPSNAAQHALDMIDIEATLMVLCPSIIEQLKVKNFGELDVRDYKLIRDEYYRVIAPFFKEIHSLLQGEEKGDEVKEA